MANDELVSELASEHHDRIESVSEQAEEAEERADEAAAMAVAAASVVPEHDHPEYVRHEELSSALDSIRGDIQSSTAAMVAAIESAAPEPEAGPEAVPEGIDVIPVPEPERQEERWVHRHGRRRKVRS